jgi:hypothetical protein
MNNYYTSIDQVLAIENPRPTLHSTYISAQSIMLYGEQTKIHIV